MSEAMTENVQVIGPSLRISGLLDALQNPKFNKQNAHFGNKYADLESILEVVKPTVREHGFRLFQSLNEKDWLSALIDVETGVTVMVVRTPFITEKQSPQSVGSALTYYRRYGILLLLNLVGEEDDDAEKAEGRGKKTTKKETKKENW